MFGGACTLVMYICVVCLNCVSVCLSHVMFLILDRKVGPKERYSLPSTLFRSPGAAYRAILAGLPFVSEAEAGAVVVTEYLPRPRKVCALRSGLNSSS